jgi:hypothetical protein
VRQRRRFIPQKCCFTSFRQQPILARVSCHHLGTGDISRRVIEPLNPSMLGSCLATKQKRGMNRSSCPQDSFTDAHRCSFTANYIAVDVQRSRSDSMGILLGLSRVMPMIRLSRSALGTDERKRRSSRTDSLRTSTACIEFATAEVYTAVYQSSATRRRAPCALLAM